MGRARKAIVGLGAVAGALWAATFGLFGLAVLVVAPVLGLFAMVLAALPLASVLLLWLSSEADRPLTTTPGWKSTAGPVARQTLETGLLSAVDLAVPMAGPGSNGPWMPVDVASATPPAVRLLGPDGEALPMLAEAGTVLAGPGPQQAVRHMIAAYAPGAAEAAFRIGEGNRFGFYGAEVTSLTRVPDAYPVGEARTTIRVLAATGVVSHVVMWRRGPLVAHLAASGDEALAGVLLGHATQAADGLLAQLGYTHSE